MPRKKLTPREYAEVSAEGKTFFTRKLCKAERMKAIQEAIVELKKEVKSLRRCF